MRLTRSRKEREARSQLVLPRERAAFAHALIREEGVEVTEVWESAEQAQAWIDTAVAPMLRAAGAPVPTPEVRPIRQLLVASYLGEQR